MLPGCARLYIHRMPLVLILPRVRRFQFAGRRVSYVGICVDTDSAVGIGMFARARRGTRTSGIPAFFLVIF